MSVGMDLTLKFHSICQYLPNSEFKQTVTLSLKKLCHRENKIIEVRTGLCKCVGDHKSHWVLTFPFLLGCLY